MTVKLVVLYTQPEDAEAFEQHYLGAHGPLVEKIPGLVRFEGARFTATADEGEASWHRVAELWFEDVKALQAGMSSDEGKATGKDYEQIAPPGSRRFIATVD